MEKYLDDKVTKTQNINITSYCLKLAHKLNKIVSCRFVKNAGWLGSAELFNRISRLVTAIILARYLTPLEFGLAAIALTANDLVKVLGQNGIGAKIVQAEECELKDICDTAYRLNWIYCGSLFTLQCIVAFVVAFVNNQLEIAYLIASLAIVYLIIPFALVQAFLLQRNNRLKEIALISSSQITVDNFLSAVLAIFGFGVWSIVLPKIIVAPIWVFGMLSQHDWKYTPGKKLKNVNKIFSYGKHILGAELAKALRLSIDNIIVAYYFGLEVAGLYFFAKNAGMGISLSLVSAFNLSLFAHLCDFKNNLSHLRKEFIKSLKLALLILVPIILIQGFLAPWYVPIVFGEQWEPSVFVLLVLCLSVIPRIFGEAAGEYLKTIGKPEIESRWNVYFSTLFIIAILSSLNWGIEGVAVSIFISHLLFPVYCYWVVSRHAQKNISSPILVNNP